MRSSHSASSAARSVWLLALLATSVACGHAAPGARGAGTAAAPERSAGASEQSVRPGVNARYYEPGALEKWRGVLEGESREVVRKRDAIVAAVHLAPGARVADLGAGTGLFTLALSQAVGPEGRVYAVEIVPAFLERLRALAGRADNVVVVEGQEQRTALPARSVDVALLINVYHHLEYPRTYLRSVLESLAPGGRVVVVDFERIEGVTPESMLKHVRADRQTVRAEIESVGLRLAREEAFLKENYFMEFRAP